MLRKPTGKKTIFKLVEKVTIIMTDRLLTPQEIAKYLGVKPSTIYQWTHQKFIPHFKLGGLLRFAKTKVDDWLEKRSIAGKTNRRITI